MASGEALNAQEVMLLCPAVCLQELNKSVQENNANAKNKNWYLAW